MNVLAVLIALAVVIALDIAALRYGADSREHFDSSEWEQRRERRGLNGG